MNGFLGSLSEVIFFKNHRDSSRPEGYLLLAPYTECRTPDGYSREVARTLGEIDSLQRTLCAQERRRAEHESLHDEVVLGERYAAVTDALRQKMVSGSTSAFERDFIEAYLRLREDKRDRHRQRFLEYTSYLHLHARENDMPRNRDEGEEKISLDRINF